MADYSIYPKALDGYAQIPLAVDRYSPVNAESVNRLRSASVNIENTLGIAPHISDHEEEFLDVNERLDDIEAQFDFDLDRAYDGRGIRERDPQVRGSGRIITADSGAVRIVNETSDQTNSLEIVRNDGGPWIPESESDSRGRAIHVTGSILVMGMTEGLLYANKQKLQQDVTVPEGINGMLIEEVGIPVGMTLDIEVGANLLIL